MYLTDLVPANTIAAELSRERGESMSLKLLAAGICAAGLSVFASLPSHAQSSAYPNKPLKMVVPFPPGGAADQIGRAIASKMPDTLGQPVIIDNRSGAAGAVGVDFAAKQAPDGYTILLGTISTHGTSPALNTKLPYDAVKDFTHLSLVAVNPLVLLVHPDVPAKTLQEFVNVAKASPGIPFGSNGNGSYNHLAVELLKGLANIDLLHVPYKGAAPVMNDLIAGQIKFAAADLAGATPYIRAGRVRPLAVGSTQRIQGLDLPTVAESGYPSFQVTAWYAIFAPAGMPAPIVNRLHGSIVKALATPEIQQQLTNAGAIPVGETPAHLAAFVKSEVTRWSGVAKNAKITAD
jgi:tripartite-type tricarboxylate transporter receptor subunit TctC